MVIVMVIMVLLAVVRLGRSPCVSRSRLFGHTTPDAKPRRCRQQTATSGARIPGLGAGADRELCTRDTAGDALDRLHGRGDRLVIRLGPMKVSWEPMKELLHFAVLPGLILFCVWRIRVLWAHVHLTDAIVGESVNLAGGK
jgi:hypothetical protein